MGLDFSHCEARWAYSGFFRFRLRLAKEIGFNEYEEIKTIDDPRYSKISKDPILPLLAHSDCDGDLGPEECKKVAPRLREIVSKWPDDDYDKEQALELADGMDAAAASSEPLKFR
jgi:hypothetical protein